MFKKPKKIGDVPQKEGHYCQNIIFVVFLTNYQINVTHNNQVALLFSLWTKFFGIYNFGLQITPK